jgi:hypothetical protein
MNDIGIYVLTYPGDYYLSTALIRSLKYFNPDIPVMIIPGEGLDLDDNPFNVPIMSKPGGFWGQIGHASRKFWAFQGPFEKFIYLDGDVICTRPLTPLIEQIQSQSGTFINVEISISDDIWIPAIRNTEHELHQHCLDRVRLQLGNIELLCEFDPKFDPYSHYTFNNGIFASRRMAIDEQAFEDLYNREAAFFRNRLNKEFSWKHYDLFFGDQGRLNYLVEKLGIVRAASQHDRLMQWGGEPKNVTIDTVLAGAAESYFIHWAGCPRPSPSIFCKQPFLPLLILRYPGLSLEYRSLKEIPAYSVWLYFSADEQQRWGKISERFKWTWRDLKKILYRNYRSYKKSLKQIIIKD